MDVIIVSLIVAVTSLFAPLLLAHMTNRHRQVERLEDYARQDAVAAQAAEAARLLLAENRKVARTAVETSDKLDVIHTLVNSNMTNVMQSELDTTVRLLAVLEEVTRLNEAAGRASSNESRDVIAATRAKIVELRAGMADRAASAELADQLHVK